jgi:hypothetical protein
VIPIQMVRSNGVGKSAPTLRFRMGSKLSHTSLLFVVSDWEFLQKYSPYHNIDATADYPPMLITTSTRDDRVHPAHARKMTKKLQDMGKGKDWKVHYYENIEGGHGGAADAKQSAFMVRSNSVDKSISTLRFLMGSKLSHTSLLFCQTALAYDFMFAELTKNIQADN